MKTIMMQCKLMTIVIAGIGVLLSTGFLNGGLPQAAAEEYPDSISLAGVAGSQEDDDLAKLKAQVEELVTKIPPDKVPILGGRVGAEIAERLRFQGDLRLRTEYNKNRNFSDGADRYRQRMRLRFGLTAQVTDDLTAGFRMGSGNPNFVNTAEINLSDGFSRKTFLNLDNAYLRYKPNEWSTTTGGKFGVPWWRPSAGNMTAEIVWDNDVQPEGIVQQFHRKDVGIFSELGVTGGVLVVDQFDEAKDFDDQGVRRLDIGNKNPGNLMFGGQALASLDTPGLEEFGLGAGKAKFGTAFYAYENADSIAGGQLGAREGPLGNMTNKLRGPMNDDGTGRIAKCNGDGKTRDCSFVSDYQILEINGQYDAEFMGLPIGFFFDIAHNFGAKAGSDFAGNEIGKENDAFQVYATVGKLRKPGDWLIGYGYADIEADAAIGQYNSDDLQFTNTQTQTIFLEYQVQKNVSLIWDTYLQYRENEELSRWQGNSSFDADSPMRIKSRINVLVKF
tara:strand:+ start:5234 stop:6745 length:1512 start_codon:yes stop_codon:yes gene_type:complete